jgi:serine/threonine protein kinase
MILHEQQQEIPQLFYSSALQGIISRCLAKNPKNRPSAEELLMLIPVNNLASPRLSSDLTRNYMQMGVGEKGSRLSK